MTISKIGELDAIVREGSSSSAVVLLHGYGADCKDLAPLSDYLDREGQWSWYFPNAPLEVPIGPSWMGRAWFEIDAQALEEAMRNNTYRRLADKKPEGFQAAQNQVEFFMEEIQEKHDKIIIGGFSQGAMLATNHTLLAPVKPDALVILSGTLINAEEWNSAYSQCGQLPFFQSHGLQDPLLDPAAAEELYQNLKNAGFNGQYHSFTGGHEIPPAILDQLNLFLKETLD